MNMNPEVARTQMINQQVRAWDVLDPKVLDALSRVRREEFVPPRFRTLAFADTAIPLGDGEVMMTPQVEGRLLQALSIAPTDRILEVGTGSGFLTACLCALGDGILSLELRPGFVETARRTLHRGGFDRAEVLHADVFRFSPRQLFDVIAVTGSLPCYDIRFQQWLRPGGRLFVVAGTPPAMEARLVQRLGEDQWSSTALFETEIPPLVDAPLPEPFRF